MEENPVPNFLEDWIKPIVFIIAVFIIGFSIPVLLKNYLSQKTGILPAPSPPNTALNLANKKQLAPPYFQFESEQADLSPGETVEVKVLLNTAKRTLEAYDFTASYDPEIITVTAVEATPLFSTYPAIEYGEGKILISGEIAVEREAFSLNDAIFAVITLEGRSRGETALILDKDQSTIYAGGENIIKDSNTVKISVD